jgi:archaeal flagellar protein FlaI
MVEITDLKKSTEIEEKFQHTISVLINKYFPDMEEKTKSFLTTYLIQKSLGLGNLEIVMNDNFLEEIVINSPSEPVWVYHKKLGWLKTNIYLGDDDKTRHYATVIGRKVGRQISVLEPLLDAHLNEGDRVNATLYPISTAGNTLTFRRFSRSPFTISHFLETNTMNYEAASLIWLSMQYELSAIIAGGTASGKTSTLNVLASFFPPNQRIISIEDTREIKLPKFLHWVPMSTRIANAEKRGEVSMGDLLVNSLRMRPDRILVGEVRRKQEAETLFEAIHTGHSVYATFHANTAEETVQRLTNPPIDIPKIMLPAISLVIIQFRNRRTGQRRTFQLAEITKDSEANVLMQYDAKKDALVNVNKSKYLMTTIKLFTGFSDADIKKDLKEKQSVLKYLVKNKVNTVDGVGRVMAEYYTRKDHLMDAIKKNKKLGD